MSAVKDVIHKPALENWKINNAALYAVRNLDSLTAVAAKDRDAAVTLVKAGAAKDQNKAADRGTEVHSLCEQLMRDQLAGRKSRFKVSDEDMKFLRNFARFIKTYDVRPVAVELTVWSVEHKYAGRLDLLAWLLIDGEWQLCIVDYKTGESGIWPDAAIQQCAYLNADHHHDDHAIADQLTPGWPATRRPDASSRFKTSTYEPDRAFALWLRPDGWALTPLDTGEETWQEFLRRRASYQWELEKAKATVGAAINENPLRRKWKPPARA